MTDPRRLLEDGGLTDSERSALVAAQSLRPPSGFAEASWAALVAALGPPPGTPAGGSSDPAGGGGAAAAGSAGAGGSTTLLGKLAAVSLAKAVGIGAVVGSLVTTAVVGVPAASSSPPSGEAQREQSSHEATAEAIPRPAPVAADTPGATIRRAPSETSAESPAEDRAVSSRGQTSAPVPGVLGRETETVPGRVVAARGVPRAEPTNPHSGSGPAPSVAGFEVRRELAAAGEPAPVPSAAPPSVQEEARLVGRAREALRGGDAALALQKLEESGARFPDGAVRQEREALTIEALVRLGRRVAAAERAVRFFRDFPGSPYAARVRGFVRPP